MDAFLHDQSGMIRLEHFPTRLRGLDEALRRSAASLDLDHQFGPYELVGPLRTYTADPIDFVESQGAKVESVGWIGLAVAGDRPIAAIEILLGDTLLGLRRPKYAIYGASATKALHRAMALAELATAGPQDQFIRILTIPALYVSALWLDGETSRWIPYEETRPEHEPSVMQGAAFIQFVRGRLEASTASYRGGDADSAPSDDGGDDSNAPGERLRNWRPS